MKEYRESTDGLSSVYGDPLPYIYEVTAYKAPSTGKLAFDWTIGLEGTDLQSTKNFAFEVLENGKISETDLYGFLPDCVPEYEKFIANHEPISLVNGYVVICENEPENPINTNVISITGYGELKKVIRESIANENIFTGKDISGYLAVYKSVASGTAKVNYSLAGQFGFNANETVVDTKFYEIDDELNIRETDESEFIEPVPGDVNNDYQLTIADLILVQKFIFGADELSHRHNADLYNDNKIDAYDMCLMRKRLIETFAES